MLEKHLNSILKKFSCTGSNKLSQSTFVGFDDFANFIQSAVKSLISSEPEYCYTVAASSRRSDEEIKKTYGAIGEYACSGKATPGLIEHKEEKTHGWVFRINKYYGQKLNLSEKVKYIFEHIEDWSLLMRSSNLSLSTQQNSGTELIVSTVERDNLMPAFVWK